MFPTQIEELLLTVGGLAPHFQLILTRPARQDELNVRVEARPDASSERHTEAAAELHAAIRDNLGIRVEVTVTGPGVVERSAGKMRRVLDERPAGVSSAPVAGRGTTATIALERARIPFTVHEYDHDPRQASYGLEAVSALGADPSRVFKTLVAEVDGTLTVGVVPVDRQLDLKALAAAAGGKRAKMAEVADAERATGYVAGGISPLGQRKRLPVIIDASALASATIYCSAGRRGLEIELAPADLIRAAGATVAAIAA